MKRFKLLITPFCILWVMLFISCSGSTNNKGKEIVVFDVTGYYDGELIVSKKNKSGGEDIAYEPIKTTILIREASNGEHECLISNFEWENQETRNISFNVQIDKEDKSQEAKLDGYISANRNEIIPNTEMVLVGEIRDLNLAMQANFTAVDKEYIVLFKGVKSSKIFATYKFSFEEWVSVVSDKSSYKHQIPEYESGVSWNTTDFAIGVLRDLRRVDKFTVTSSSTAFDGKKSASIQTVSILDAQEYTNLPFVYAGYLYSGYYDTAKQGLEAAQVGLPFDKEPLSIKGYYMYAPGKKYYRCLDISKPSNVELVEDVTDECLIGIYLYQVASDDEYLSLKEILTSDKVVGSAVFTLSLIHI